MLFQTGIALSLLVFTQMLAINSFYQEHIWSLWTLPDLTIKSRNSPPSAVLFSLNYFRQRLVASVPPPVLADSRLLVPRRPFLPALSAQQTCCCCCGCPDILQPLCSSSAAAQILVPCSAAAQMLCLPCFCCCCLHPDTLHCPTLLHLIYPTGNSFLSSDTQSQLYRKSGDGSSTPQVKEGGWVVDSSFHFLNISQCTQQIKRKWYRYQLRRNI